jgi:hypothetical protein
VRPLPALDFRCPAATRTFRLLPLALLQPSGVVSGSSSGLVRFPFPVCFALRLPCLTTEKSHQRLSRTIVIFRLIHRQQGLRWIKRRTRNRQLLAGNYRSRSRNFSTNEYGLHAVHEGRSYRQAGGGEEEESARPVNISKDLLSLKPIWRLPAYCAIAKRKMSVARNATNIGLPGKEQVLSGLYGVPRQRGVHDPAITSYCFSDNIVA